MRRLSMIVKLLNTGRHFRTIDLLDELNERYGITACKSSIEKDMFFLKMNFDIDDVLIATRGTGGGYQFSEPIDFIDRLKSYLNLEV